MYPKFKRGSIYPGNPPNMDLKSAGSRHKKINLIHMALRGLCIFMEKRLNSWQLLVQNAKSWICIVKRA